MRNPHASSTGIALGLVGFFGLLVTFVGCSGSVSHGGAGCDYNGKEYAVGDKFPASDGCNQCSCGEGGDVQCTLIGCDPGSACESLVSELKATLSSAQKCASAADCGQPIPGSSCGCTRDLVARKDANLAPYLELRAKASEQACETDGGSTCDCPSADGFACIENVCTWNYTNTLPDPTCEPVDAADLCVRGTAAADGELIEAGDQLQITVRSAGCLSGSCSKVIEASCTIGSGVNFEAKANFCVADTSSSGQGCTDDCGTAHADCSFGQALTAGYHQVNLGSIAVGFQVPSKLPLGGLCAGAAR